MEPDHANSNGALSDCGTGITRRQYLVTVTAVTGCITLDGAAGTSEAAPAEAAGEVNVSLTINGQQHALRLDPRVTLLDLLRNELNLTGTKKGCDHGQCGACTVLANGRRINSCLSLACSHYADKITTIEGLAQGENLHQVQAAFIEHDGFQCGYCTPGQVCSGVAMLAEARNGDLSFVTADLTRTGPADLTDDEIRERMSGNICRCGAYPGIVAAVKAAATIKTVGAE